MMNHNLFVRILKQLCAQVVKIRDVFFSKKVFHSVFFFAFHMPKLGRVSNLVCVCAHTFVCNSELFYTY